MPAARNLAGLARPSPHYHQPKGSATQRHRENTTTPPRPRDPAHDRARLPAFLPTPREQDDILSQRINATLANSLAKATNTNYSHAVRAFEKFCSEQDLDISRCFPADEFYLCAFAASLSSNYSGTTANSLVAGLKAWHTMHNMTWHGSPRLQMVLRGVDAMAPESSKRPIRAPVSLEMLRLLDRHLSHTDPFDAAVLAAALVAFWGQCRLGELLGSSRLKHDPSKYPSRSSLSGPISQQGSRELLLPSTKTHRVTGESIVITYQLAPADPVAALLNHLHISKNIPPTRHLFAFNSSGRNGVHCLTKEVFLNRCNEIWKAHGIERATGHAFRIGGTTGLLHAGIPPEVVRSMGRWASDAHFRYWRDAKNIAIKHAEGIPTTKASNTSLSVAPVRLRPTRAARASNSSRGRPY